ncbi:MAG: hypothetical protein AB7N70_39680, partial [Dehalococcoidia bacterium]
MLETGLPTHIEGQSISSYFITGLRAITSVADAVSRGSIEARRLPKWSERSACDVRPANGIPAREPRRPPIMFVDIADPLPDESRRATRPAS